MELTNTLGQIVPIDRTKSLNANIAEALAAFAANPFLAGLRPVECRLHPIDTYGISEEITVDILLVISRLTIPGHLYLCVAEAPNPRLGVPA